MSSDSQLAQMSSCHKCGTQITPDDQGSWVDETDGDGCREDDGVHEPAPASETSSSDACARSSLANAAGASSQARSCDLPEPVAVRYRVTLRDRVAAWLADAALAVATPAFRDAIQAGGRRELAGLLTPPKPPAPTLFHGRW
jgi:hypothetical protein